MGFIVTSRVRSLATAWLLPFIPAGNSHLSQDPGAKGYFLGHSNPFHKNPELVTCSNLVPIYHFGLRKFLYWFLSPGQISRRTSSATDLLGALWSSSIRYGLSLVQKRGKLVSKLSYGITVGSLGILQNIRVLLARKYFTWETSLILYVTHVKTLSKTFCLREKKILM
jgi:hypothetical protein